MAMLQSRRELRGRLLPLRHEMDRLFERFFGQASILRRRWDRATESH